jgi:hypothetical protein
MIHSLPLLQCRMRRALECGDAPVSFLASEGIGERVGDALHREGLPSRAHDVEPCHTLGSIHHHFSSQIILTTSQTIADTELRGRVLRGNTPPLGNFRKTFSALASQRVARPNEERLSHATNFIRPPLRFPPVVIRHALWLYLRFTLSSRDVEDLLTERGWRSATRPSADGCSRSGRLSRTTLGAGDRRTLSGTSMRWSSKSQAGACTCGGRSIVQAKCSTSQSSRSATRPPRRSCSEGC